MMQAREIAARLGLKRYPRSCAGAARVANTAPRRSRCWRLVRAGRLYCANGCPDELIKTVARAIGERAPPRDRGRPQPARRDRQRDRAIALWSGSIAASGTLADRYSHCGIAAPCRIAIAPIPRRYAASRGWPTAGPDRAGPQCFGRANRDPQDLPRARRPQSRHRAEQSLTRPGLGRRHPTGSARG